MAITRTYYHHPSLTFLSIGDNEHGFSLRWTAAEAGGVIQALIAKSILEVTPTAATVLAPSFSDVYSPLTYAQNALVGLFARVSSYIWPAVEKPYYPFLSKLADTGRPLNELVATVVGLAVGSSVNYAQGTRPLFRRPFLN